MRYVVESLSADKAPQWILCLLQSDERVNGLQLLRLLEREKGLHKTCVSLLLGESEMDCLDYAFAHGMLSWHRRQDLPASTRQTYKTFFDMAKEQKFNSTLISAQAIGTRLKTARRFEELARFYERLVSCLPQEASILYGLAEAQFYNEQREEAIQTLSECSFYNLPNWKKMAEQFLKEGEFEKIRSPLNSMLIAHSEEHSLSLLAGHAQSLGVEHIEQARDGFDVWRAVEDGALPQVLVLCNDLEGIKTTALVQRIRTEISAHIPIVIMVERISKAEKTLFDEMNVTQVVHLSLERETFIKVLLNAYRSDRFGGTAVALMRKVRQALRNGSKIEAEHAYSVMTVHGDVSESELAYAEAEILLSEGRLEPAKNKALSALKGMSQQFMALELLGRIFLRLGDTSSAQMCLSKAQDVSPLHVDRLCEIAQLLAAGGKSTDAMTFLDKAKLLDPTRTATVAQESALALQSGSFEHVKNVFAGFAQLDDLVAMLNNRGVALVLSNQVDDGLAFYQNVLKVLPADRTDLLARVQYNLGLGHARCKNLKESLAILEMIDAKKIELLQKKVDALRNRAAEALATGGSLVFVSDLNALDS